MDRTVKILLASAILLTGTSAAMLFRRPAPEVAPLIYSSGDPLVLRQRMEPQIAAAPAITERPAARIESRPAEPLGVAAQLPTILRPMDPGQPPPELARAYPGGADAPISRPAISNAAGFGRPQPGQTPSQTHKIVDGDTLTGLAERYLGSGARFLELFEANRDVLSTPELLPIGRVLRIPPANAVPLSHGDASQSIPVTASPAMIGGKRLVPVAPRPLPETSGDAG